MEPISAAIIGGAGLLGGIFGRSGGSRISAEERAAAAAQARTVNYLNELVQNDLTPRAYTPFEGERVAGFTPRQQRAFSISDMYTDGVMQNWGPLDAQSMRRTTQSNALADRGAEVATGVLGGNFYDAPIDRYMNPYLENVLEPARRDLERAFERQRNDLNATAARTGSFGGSRNAVAQAQLERNMLEGRSDLEAESRFRAFDDAARRFQQDRETIPAMISEAQRQQAAGQGAIRNNIDLSNLQFQNAVAPMMTVGGMEQGLNQRQLDVDYANFLEERDWGRNEALTRIGALQGAANTSRIQQSPSGTAQGIGAGLGIGSMIANSGIGNWLGNQASSWFGNSGNPANSGYSSNLAAAAGTGAFVDPTFGGASY